MKLSFLIITLLLTCSTPAILSQDLVWSQEAENGILEGSADINQACANASGGEFVRLHSDDANGLVFNNLNVPEAGTYRLSIDYYYKGEQPLEILVNGNSAGIFIFPFSIWCYEGNASIMDIAVELDAGDNTLKFKPANGMNAPFLDKIELFTIEPPHVNLSASATRVQPGAEVQIIIEANDILKNDNWVGLEVAGIAAQSYTLADETVTIPLGSSVATTTIAFADQGISHGTNVTVSIASTGSGLSTGENTALLIRIIQQPEVMYVSSSMGSDLHSGVEETKPWKTLEKVSSLLFLPGDTLLFRAGDTFTGQFRINSSGNEDHPIYVGKYGEGDDPVIDGANATGGAYTSAILIENQDHITIRNLAITNDRKISRPGTSDEIAYGIEVLNSGDRVMKGFHFSDLTIKEIFAVSTEDVEFNNLQTAGIHIRSMRNEEAGKEKNISGVLVENCYFTHTAKAGIWSRHNNATAGLGNDSINRNMNLVFRNNYFYETGGSGIILSRSYNCLLENNVFEYTGADADPRMAKRGSGAWFWNCRNVLAQYNTSLHVRGPADSYGMHIDFANEHIFLQYNYSEDSEGGFVEILGDNKNSVYRFNISVNDGFRDRKGNSLWVSDYAGSGVPGIKSDNNYIYNNTVYVDADITPDIMITGRNTFVYNNIFYAAGNAVIGETVDLNTASSGSLNVSNNLFFGNVSNQFRELDLSAVEGDPLLADPGVSDSNGYMLREGSIAMNAGRSFTEPVFPQAGKGIFKDIPLIPETDYFGNPVAIATSEPHIGAYGGMPASLSKQLEDRLVLLNATFDPASDAIRLTWISPRAEQWSLSLVDISGRILYSEDLPGLPGRNTRKVSLSGKGSPGIVMVVLTDGRSMNTIKVPVR